MADFLVYHNPDKMGYPASDVTELSIVTNRSASGAKGARVWLVTGEGQPRVFKLRGYFIVDQVGRSDHPDFKIEVSGSAGRLFKRMPDLNDLDWFADFKRSQGNFAFGFQPIKDPRFVKGLLAVAETTK